MIRELLAGKKYLFLNGDDDNDRTLIENANTEDLRSIVKGYSYVFIDEVQRIANVGLKLKIIIDQIKEAQLIVSGSSSLDINNAVQEPLTGRNFEYHLFPIAWSEFEDEIGYVAAQKQLEMRLIYGMYPDVLNNLGDEYKILQNLTTSYLYKDIFDLSNIRLPEVLDKIVRALAFQIGSQVSYNEIANLVGVDKQTVSNYIDLLEKAYIVFRMNSYHNNHRDEIKFNRKIYFYDNGIRNMVIGDLNRLEIRQDVGKLWENFLMAERKKALTVYPLMVRSHFWRTTRQQEIDYVEEENRHIRAFEFKWNDRKKVHLPKAFREAYGDDFTVINRSNFRKFIEMSEVFHEGIEIQ